MTLHEIAAEVRLTQAELRSHDKRRADWVHDHRRTFVLKAFSVGHDPNDICDFIDRSAFMVLHALRMGCMERAGGDYGRTLKQLADELRRVAA